jgi:hypothetical protein
MQLVKDRELYHVLALLVMGVYAGLDGKLGSLLLWNDLN